MHIYFIAAIMEVALVYAALQVTFPLATIGKEGKRGGANMKERRAMQTCTTDFHAIICLSTWYVFFLIL